MEARLAEVTAPDWTDPVLADILRFRLADFFWFQMDQPNFRLVCKKWRDLMPLSEIHLSKEKLADSNLEILSHMLPLSEILVCAPGTPEDLSNLSEAISKSSTLTTLEFDGSFGDLEVTSRFIRSLSGCRRLRYLVFTESAFPSDIGDALNELVANHTSLQSLHCANAGLNEASFSALAESLRVNNSMKEIYVSGDRITAGALVLADVLKTHRRLFRLYLRRAELDLACAIALGEALRTNQSLLELNIGENPTIGDEGVEAIARSLEFNSTLQLLSFATTTGSEPSTFICPGGVSALGRALEFNKTLTSLDLYGVAFDSDAAVALAAGVRRHPALTDLELERCEIPIHGCKSILSALSMNSTLKTFRLDGDESTEANEEVSALISKNTSLTKLYLGGGAIDGTSNLLGDAIGANTTLTTLSLDFQPLTRFAWRSLADGLIKNTILRELRVDDTSITKKVAEYVAEVLTRNSTLSTLSMGSNSIEDDGLENIGQALIENNALTELELEYVGATDAGIAKFTSCLRNNTKLTRLNLNYNPFADDGVLAIAELIRSNPAIKLLQLYGAEMRDDVKATLIEAIDNHPIIWVNFDK